MGIFSKQGKHARGDNDQALEVEQITTEEEKPSEATAPDAAESTELAEGGAETGESAAPVVEPVAVAGEDAEKSSDGEKPMADPAAVAEAALKNLEGFDVDAGGFPQNSEVADPGAFVASTEIPKKRGRKALKAFGITFGALIGVALIAYIVGAVVFMGRFLPNTVIGSYDISMKSDEEVVQMLDEAASSYQLDIVGGTFSYRTTGPQIGMEIDSKGIVEAMHQDLSPWQWPVLIAQVGHDETARLEATYDQAALSADIAEKVKAFNETATAPVNATITYDQATRSYKVKPEEAGTQWNADAVNAVVAESVPLLQTKVSLANEQLVQPTVLSDDKKLNESAQIATGLVSADVILNMGGQQVGEVTGESLSSFVSIDDKLDVKFNDDALNEWVEELADGYNTIGTERTYVRPDGKEITVEGGSYGWEIDTETLRDVLIENVKAGAKTTIDVPCYSDAAVYNGVGQPDWGGRYLDVDISEQYVRFYDGENIIWESACITGSPDGKHDTVPGVWYINNKESPSKLIGYENGKKIYETTVTFWMAFETSEIGFHDATWQPSFGGSMYASGYGSHGCVNLPYNAAAELYNISEIGDVVIVHH